MRYAICNETFEGWEHSRICQTIAELGYAGLEIAPFTLASRINEVSPKRRQELRQQANNFGIDIIGLHWLLAKTEGLQITSPDPTIRQTTADYLVDLARCCRDLGGDILVFGSPLQRQIPAGHSREQAIDLAVDTFHKAKAGIADCGVRLCLEPLAPAEADFINTCQEAVHILDSLAHPNFVLHVDVKAMSSESHPIPELLRTHKDRIGHFHANDPNKRGPGFGDTDFRPIFKTLQEIDYRGWVSVEVFDYTPDPLTIARESIHYMKQCNPA